jgi:hypothetical protein
VRLDDDEFGFVGWSASVCKVCDNKGAHGDGEFRVTFDCFNVVGETVCCLGDGEREREIC